ncbi:MAG: MFS transporter [Candidatus Lokiarchaeota archaeon]|nr:MFS transporter [Candidatus Lokiarchaeota archaeon]
MSDAKVGYFDRVRFFKRDARLYIASSAINSFAFGISNVIFNLYMKEAGFSEDFLGFFLSVSMFATGFIAVGAGMFSDRHCRKRIILSTKIIVLLSLAVQYTVLNPAYLLLSQVSVGLASAFTQVSWAPYITDLSTDEERAHLFGFGGGLSLIAVLMGNLSGGFLPPIFMNLFNLPLFNAFQFALWVSLLPLVIATLLITPMTKDEVCETEKKISFENVRNWRFIGKYATTVSTIGLGAGMIVLFFNLFFENEFQADSSLIGVIFAINTLLLAAGNFLAPALADRIGKVRTVVVTEALSIPFLLMISWAPVLYLAVIAYVMRTVLMNMAGPVSNAFFMEGLSREERATASGVVNSGNSIVRGIAANIGGWMLALGLYRLPYLVVSGLYVLGVVLFFVFFKNKEEEIEQLREVEIVRSHEDEAELDVT